MSGIEAFSWGLFGGFIAEALTWYKDRRNPTTALPWRKYWFTTIIMIFIGGGLVLMYLRSGAGLNPILMRQHRRNSTPDHRCALVDHANRVRR